MSTRILPPDDIEKFDEDLEESFSDEFDIRNQIDIHLDSVHQEDSDDDIEEQSDNENLDDAVECEDNYKWKPVKRSSLSDAIRGKLNCKFTDTKVRKRSK